MKDSEWPDIPIRITFDYDSDPPEVLKSDFTDNSLRIIKRLHGSRVADMLLLPVPVPLQEVKELPWSSTTSSKLFTRLLGWWARFGKRG